MNNKLPNKILVVDNDEGILNGIENALKSQQITVVKSKTWQDAFFQYNHQKFELCVLCLELEGMIGTAIVQKWREHQMASKRNPAFIIMTGKQRTAGDENLIKEIEDIVILLKPIIQPSLLSAMVNATNLKELRETYSVFENQLDALIKAKKFDKAVLLAKEKLEHLGPRGKFNTAIVHEKVDNSIEALKMLQELLSHDPTNIKYHNEIGKIYLKQGNLEAARHSFEIADKAAPFNIKRVKEMADLYLQLKEPEKSIEKFKDMIKLNSEDTDLKFDLYDQLFKAGFKDHARSFCKETSTPKELIRHFNNKGVMSSKEEDYVTAIDEYTKATNLIPGNKELYRILFNMAIAHMNLKTPEHLKRAHALLAESLKLEPTFDKAQEKIKITEKFIKSIPTEKK